MFGQTGVAITEHLLGNHEQAQAVFDALVSEYGDSSLYQQTQVMAQWGETDHALALLERAYVEGDPGVLFALNDPLLDPIRNDAEFDSLLLRYST